MKKLIFSIVALAFATTTIAQTKEAATINKKLSRISATIAKKGEKSKYFVNRAKIYIDAANAYTDKLIPGFTIEQTTLLIGEPLSKESTTVQNAPYTIYKYPNFDLYVNDQNVVIFWTTKTSVIENELDRAYDDLVKAKSLSEDYFTPSGKAVATVNSLKGQYQTRGMSYYNLGEGAEAASDFSKSVATSSLIGAIDTMYIYYTGVAYFEAKDYDNAMNSFKELLSLGDDREGMVQYYAAQCCEHQGDTTQAISLLENAFSKYPENSNILGTLINTAISSKQDPKRIVDMIKKAQSLDSTNISLYIVESSIYNEIGDLESAYNVLDKVIAMDSSFFIAYYNYGIMKVVDADNMRKEAELVDINDVKGYDALMQKSVDLQSEAISKLEKAFEIDSKNADVADLLKQLYFPRRDKDAEKYEKYEQLAKELSVQ